MKNEADLNIISMVDRAIKVVLTLHDAQNSLGVTELSNELGLPKAMVFRALYTFAKYGLVEKDKLTEKYSLGPKFIEIGEKIKRQNSLNKIVLPFMRQLAGEIGESVSLGIKNDHQVLILESVEGESSVLVAKLSPVAPIYCSSIGKVLISADHETDIKEYFESEKRMPRTVNTIVDVEHFMAEIKSVKENGIAFDDEEYEYGLTCMGVPIFNHKREIIGGVSVSAPTSRLNIKGKENIAQKLKETGNLINRQPIFL
ncbi:IclR family transcriptional regulator [Candidatus Formimonas warabiya]|uniref:IclR family transcriptional regulator n=1 Tax=Formimonas warabiya TaxID=1761012 RepID=A0A3G1KUV7_FORW1|nr:IclR family transcriptional regulator [Candidatus Formimonas warabiya]ATW26293.1 hypothetical protein DCMF_17365 [Candidatus Formimonas warabiya]